MSIMGSSDEAMKALIKGGANYQYIDSAGNNYLHLAAGGGSPELVTLLLELKLGVNSTNLGLFTPAHYAAQNGHLEVMEVLDKWGGDFTLLNASKKTPMDLVHRIRPPFRMDRHEEVETYLKKWLARPTNSTSKAVTQP
jgi:ankyrin repeat protein